MSEIIEHNDGSNVPEIKVGESGAVSFKVYQDIYHQITGRTEQIKKRYSNNLLIEFLDIEQLHHKVLQLRDVHQIIADNHVVSVFHDKERKDQFSSFDRFRLYNTNATSPTVNLVLKYNFAILPAGIKKPQEYAVTIRLTSRVAMLKKAEESAPPAMRGYMIGFLSENTVEVTVDYADYVIARGFLEAVDEWVCGCKTVPKKKWLDWLRRWSFAIPSIIKFCFVWLIAWYSIETASALLNNKSTLYDIVRFAIIYSSAFYILLSLGSAAGRLVESGIDNYPTLSYLKLNKGDEKVISEFVGRKTFAVFSFVIGTLFTIILGVVSSRLDKFFYSS
jgi:hypothetical protein